SRFVLSWKSLVPSRARGATRVDWCLQRGNLQVWRIASWHCGQHLGVGSTVQVAWTTSPTRESPMKRYLAMVASVLCLSVVLAQQPLTAEETPAGGGNWSPFTPWYCSSGICLQFWPDEDTWTGST